MFINTSLHNDMTYYNIHRYIRFSGGFLAGFLVFSAMYYFNGKSIFRNIKSTKRKLVIFFGDSITQRGWETDRKGYVAQMSEWWKRKVDILNRGYSGYNSRWGLSIMEANVLSINPDLVAIFFGANDAIDTTVPQHVPLQEYVYNIERMIQQVQRMKKLVILITPPPVYEKDLEMWNSQKGKPLLRDRENTRTLTYVHACLVLGKKYNIPVIDLFMGCEGNRGNEKLFELLKVTIAKRLPQWLPDNLPFDELEATDMINSFKK